MAKGDNDSMGTDTSPGASSGVLLVTDPRPASRARWGGPSRRSRFIGVIGAFFDLMSGRSLGVVVR